MKKKLFLKLLHNKSWHEDFKWFRNRIMLLIMLPVFVLGLIITVNYAGKLENQNKSNIDLTYQQMTTKLSTTFANLGKIWTIFENDHSVIEYLAKDIDEYNSVEGVQKANYLKNQIANAHTYVESLASLELYSMKSGYVMSSGKGVGMSGYAEKIQPQWYVTYKETGNTRQVYADDEYIVVTYPITSGGLAGIIALKLAKNRIADELVLRDYEESIAVRLVTATGEELFSYGDVTPSKTMNFKVSNLIDMTFVVGDKGHIEANKMLALYILTYIVIGTLAAYGLAVLSTGYFYSRFIEISTKGSTDNKTTAKVSENAILDMNNGEDIKDALPEKLERWKFAQVEALQLQINPHFVFNVLNYVNLEILGDDESKEKSSQIIILLSKVIGYAMSEPKHFATIVEEIKMTKKYVEIEKIKSNDGFDVVWNIDKKVLDKECIKLFLQPIVENSIMHGVKDLKGRRGKIEITATEEADKVCFTVTDNGNGMTEKQLESVRKRLKEEYKDTSRHIGLRNVNERIRLLYGDNCGVTINSDINGTKVTIKFGGGRIMLNR